MPLARAAILCAFVRPVWRPNLDKEAKGRDRIHERSRGRPAAGRTCAARRQACVRTAGQQVREEAEGFEDGEQLRDLNAPENEMMSRQVAETVNQTLEELPEELRTAITLREIEGLSYEDIANIMNCPIGTVRSRIFRAREAIAERLRPLLGTSKDRRW